jgi:hypothetical protein
VSRVRLAFIEQRFQLARRPLEKEGFDPVGHRYFVSKIASDVLTALLSAIPSAVRDPYQQKTFVCAI